MTPDTEILAVQHVYPRLCYDRDSQVLHGRIGFAARWIPKIERIELNPQINNNEYDKYFIEDEYRICVSTKQETFIASHRDVYIIGNVPNQISKNEKCQPIDLHLQKIGSYPYIHKCCLLLGDPEVANKPLLEFTNEAIVPFLYRLSYISKKGLQKARKNLWSEYSHENEGRLEYLQEHKESMDKMRKAERNHTCPCGSNRKFKKCCIDKFKAYEQIEKEYENAKKAVNKLED